MRTIFTATLITYILFLFVACTSQPTKKSAAEEKKTRILNAAEEKKREENRRRVIRILHYLPSPIEAIDLIENAELDFDEELLHSRERASDYLTSAKIALNLGVYGADLGYIKLYRKSSISHSYLVCIKGLSDELGVPESFTKETYEKVNSNYNEKNNDLIELAKAYETTERYLRSNDRNQTAALLVTGGWIEGMHLACESLAGKQHHNLRIRIAEQKYTLEQIILMLESVDQGPAVEAILRNMKLLRVKFKTVDFDYVQENLLIDSVKHTQFWKTSTWQLSDNELEEIRQTVRSLRNAAIQ